MIAILLEWKGYLLLKVLSFLQNFSINLPDFLILKFFQPFHCLYLEILGFKIIVK